MENKRILFVWPNKEQFGYKHIGISLLSSIMKRQGYDVSLFDTTYIKMGEETSQESKSKIKIFKPVSFEGYDLAKKELCLEDEIRRRLEEFNPRILAISAMSEDIEDSERMARVAKEWNKDITVVVGNKAATMNPNKVLQKAHIDYACMGEGIEFLPEFVRRILSGINPRNMRNLVYKNENGVIVKNPVGPYFQDLDSLPQLDWSIFDSRQSIRAFDGKRVKSGDHMISWGCPNSCTYCINESYRKVYGKDAGPFLRRYSVERIVSELENLVETWGTEFFKFHDEDFCLKPIKYFEALAEEYGKRVGTPFTIMANAKNLTERKAELLQKMNCASVSVGIETGNDHLRKEVLRRKETKEEIIRGIEYLNKLGIRTASFNMIGLPFETRETVMETIKLNRDCGVRYPNVSFFFPLDGTPLRDLSIQEGFYYEESDMLFRNDRPTLKLPGISHEELIALRDRFVLYVKMPDSLYRFIERSEKNDETGKRLTSELQRIYDEAVFSNNGVWDDKGRLRDYQYGLERIMAGKDETSN